jgi:hypothetical protein
VLCQWILQHLYHLQGYPWLPLGQGDGGGPCHFLFGTWKQPNDWKVSRNVRGTWCNWWLLHGNITWNLLDSVPNIFRKQKHSKIESSIEGCVSIWIDLIHTHVVTPHGPQIPWAHMINLPAMCQVQGLKSERPVTLVFQWLRFMVLRHVKTSKGE